MRPGVLGKRPASVFCRFLRAILATMGLALAGLAVAEEALTPPPLLLAEVFDAHVDPAEFWVSEKFDGVRAYWDGRQLRFRSGRQVPAPDWFIAGLPTEALDGELWLGRQRFDELAAIVRRQPPVDAEWRQVRYLIFELPGAAGDFTARSARIREIVSRTGTPWLAAVEQFHVADRAALMAAFEEVVRGGGEGLMLHRADAPYLTGRNAVLLKLKPWRDAEATVIGHEPGRGRFKGMLGALRVQMPDGKRFRLGGGFSAEVRRRPPPLGAVVSYRYQELSRRGIPRFPVFLRLRESF